MLGGLLVRKVQHIASGEIKLWEIIFLYDFLARLLLAIPVILLKEASPSSATGTLLVAAMKLGFGGLALTYFGACILGAYRNLRRGENGTLMAVVGGVYVFTQGAFYVGSIAAVLNGGIG